MIKKYYITPDYKFYKCEEFELDADIPMITLSQMKILEEIMNFTDISKATTTSQEKAMMMCRIFNIIGFNLSEEERIKLAEAFINSEFVVEDITKYYIHIFPGVEDGYLNYSKERKAVLISFKDKGEMWKSKFTTKEIDELKRSEKLKHIRIEDCLEEVSKDD